MRGKKKTNFQLFFFSFMAPLVGGYFDFQLKGIYNQMVNSTYTYGGMLKFLVDFAKVIE